MQDIDREIEARYGIKVRNITPFKDCFILNTGEGKKILKKSSFPPERITFIHGAKEHLYSRGFTNLDRYLCSCEGLPYFPFDNSFFTVSDSVEGRECNFDSREDTAAAARLLAMLHRSSNGYIPGEGSKPQNELGKLPASFHKRLNEIKKLKRIAKKGKGKFDYLFLEYANYFINSGEKVIKQLAVSGYERLVDSTRRSGCFCHHDYTHSNIIMAKNETWVINFEFCCFELKIYDIANFLRRKMRKCNWNIDEARLVIDHYRSIEPISEEEFEVMRLMLQFPQKFWRVANRFYNSRRSWSERSFTCKLKEVIEEVEHHERFIAGFDCLV